MLFLRTDDLNLTASEVVRRPLLAKRPGVYPQHKVQMSLKSILPDALEAGGQRKGFQFVTARKRTAANLFQSIRQADADQVSIVFKRAVSDDEGPLRNIETGAGVPERIRNPFPFKQLYCCCS